MQLCIVFLSYQRLNISFYYVSGKILFRMLGVLYEKRYICLWDEFRWAVTFHSSLHITKQNF
ncbi:hypothetical protein CN307_27780 [Bacillus cereus]|uniref:Uncharacterized protein n=1 Tax=Bacillus cereus TaxID=1396 RepID=A0A2A8ZS80_BACCE|nr:hypothetical protein CN307_27780 [Bacillus cereus]